MVGGAVLLIGCAHYDPNPIDATQSVGEIEKKSLDDADLKAYLAAHDHQVDEGSSWGLDDLTFVAFYFHPDLSVALAERDVAEAGVKTASQLPNPVLSVSPGYNSTSQGISPWILTTALDFPVELPPKRSLRKTEARSKAEASQYQVAAAAWQVRSRLRQAMLNDYSAQRTLTRLQEQEHLQQKIATVLEEKYKAGESSFFESSQSRLGLSQTRLMLHESERQAAVARVRLAEAIGISSQALASEPIDFSAFERGMRVVDRDAARLRALTNRADILASLADYAAAESALHLEVANQYPNLNLGPGYELDQTDNKWSLGVSLELPVNRNRGKIAEARAARELAAARFLQLQSQVLAEIDQAFVSLRAAQEKSQTARQILVEVRQAAKTTADMKKAGAVEGYELLQRELELSAGELALMDAEVQEQEAIGVLEDALQMPANSEEPFTYTGVITP